MLKDKGRGVRFMIFSSYLTVVRALLVILLLFTCGEYEEIYAEDGCPDIPICGGESLDFYMHNHYDVGNIIIDGQVVPPNTWVDFHVYATAYGECDTWVPDCNPLPCECVAGPVWERLAGSVHVHADIASTNLNGSYYLGGTSCWDPVTHASAFYHELESETELCPTEASIALSYPGTYDFTVSYNIANFNCTFGVCPETLYKYATLYVGEPINDDCSTVIGNDIGVASGIARTEETDFSIEGIMPINFTRYYNSKTAQTLTRGFGKTWGHVFDTKIDNISSNLYKITNPDGSVFYYSDRGSDAIYEAIIPKGETSALIINPDNSYRRNSKDGSVEEFNPSGYMTARIDRNENAITLIRDSENKLLTATDPVGRTIAFAYDSSSRISRITLPDGRAIDYLYNNNGLQKVTYPDESYKTYEYLFTTYLTGIKNERGQYIKKYTYDYKYRVKTSSADGTKEKVTINYVDGTHSTVTDSLGRVTTYTIDKFGGRNHATDISGPGCSGCGQSDVSYIYDENLNVTSKTDANGNVTVMTYDTMGNMLTKTEAFGTSDERTTTYTYEPTFNQVTSITDPLGSTTNFMYDNNGNLITITDAAGAVTGFTRNTQGLITQITDPLENTTDFTYDPYGNISSITDSLGNVTSFTYDIMGNPLSMTDANGKQTNYTYDQRYRITQIRDSLNQITAFTYDPAGNLTAVTDAKNNVTQFVYDSINRLQKEINALGKERVYTYDSESNITSVKDAMLRTTTYTYDNRNRPVTITHPDATQTTFSYDNNGNITGATNPNISYTITHDALNRVGSITDSLSRNISYTYDANSNRLSMTSPAGTTTYLYNNLNRLISETNPSSRVFAFGYNSLGQRTNLVYPNGVTTAYTYDAVSRLVNMLTQNSVPSTINTYIYAHDNVGNRTGMTDSAGAHNYTYDEIYRLVQATHPSLPTEQFSFDPVGNRSGTTVDAGNRLLEDATYTYQYDDSGNLTQKTHKTTGAVTAYTYDTQNRLVQVTKPGMTASYKYDPFGRRIEKNVNGTITKYLYDNEDIIIEYDGSGQIVAKYTHGPGIDEPLLMEKNGQDYYYHSDGLGSVTGITDSSGALVQTYEYDSYGKISSVLDPNMKQPFTYTGREYDDETGLYYYRARYYDAETGRFISEDPIRFDSGDVNLFRYVGNNPVNWIDPLGLMKLPPNPGGLPPGWTPDPMHRDPNGQRFRDPSGRPLDWHPGQPGKPGWGGQDHWHDPNNFGRKHLRPGCEVPDPAPMPQPSNPKPTIPWWQRIPGRIPGPLPIIIWTPEMQCLVDPASCQAI